MEMNGEILVNFVKSHGKRVHLCIEEGTHSQWLYEILRPHVYEMVVTVPAKTRGTKNDQRDASARAEELRTNSVSTRVFKDNGETRVLRDLARTHSMMVSDTTRTQNRIKSFFRSRGVSLGDISLHETTIRTDLLKRLPRGPRDAAELMFRELDAQQPIREACEKKLIEEAKKHSAYRWIISVPGLGPIRTARVIAVVVTPHRFRSRGPFWKYIGLAVDSVVSAEHALDDKGCWIRRKAPLPRGLNRNHNHTLKDVFKGAAKTVVMNMPDNPLHKDYKRCVAAGTKPELAELTLARKIAAITLAVWKRMEVYHPAKGCTR
jgi:hypothetical protein